MMMDDFTDTILQDMKGYLDITVTVPHIKGKLIVKGVAVSGLDAPWRDMPDEMRVDRWVYCCVPASALSGLSAVFVFADDVTVVDAPAYLVVGKMMDRLYELGFDVDRFMGYGEPDEWDEE